MIYSNGSKIAVLFLLALFIIFGCSEEIEHERPNILWIVSEDNSPFIGAYGDSLASTPNIDQLADRGILYENAYATTPVCAPSRFTIITGTYANSMGTENMRSTYPVPGFVKFFPRYLREAGYYTTNNSKKDYNTVDQPEAWDESSYTAHYRNRKEGQPFFHVRNLFITHESQLHQPIDTLIHRPDSMEVPPYHPDTKIVRRDWARYYDLISLMDSQVGEVLQELENSGEAENTIVFYYSDHGGVLPGSKRFMNERGLHIPMVVYIPPKFSQLGPESGSTDRLVSFVDLAPTVLSLAGIKPPDWMQGKAFLGEFENEERDFVYAYRGRMDERYDLIRAVRNKEFLYVHNYMPHRIYGQHVSYQWRSRVMREWEELYRNGELNSQQNRFFLRKPPEELYDIVEDPFNVNNLAYDDKYRDVVQYMRDKNQDWMFEYKDLGFIQESRIDSLRGDSSLYGAVREQNIPVLEIIAAAEIASQNGITNPDHLLTLLNHKDSSIRYWAVRTLIFNPDLALQIGEKLEALREDSSPAVRIATAETLYSLGDEILALKILNETLDHGNPTIKLMALNVLEAIHADVEDFSNSMAEKIRDIYEETEGDNSGSNYYLHNTTESLLNGM